jgi:hypothetical protein
MLYLTLVWRSSLAVTNSQVQFRPVVHILYRKFLNDNIYKQLELGGVTMIRLVIDFWGIGVGGTKKWVQEKGWVG